MHYIYVCLGMVLSSTFFLCKKMSENETALIFCQLKDTRNSSAGLEDNSEDRIMCRCKPFSVKKATEERKLSNMGIKAKSYHAKS